MKIDKARVMKRTTLVLDLANKIALQEDARLGHCMVSNRVDEIKLFTNYAEKGYENPASGVIAVGNWNAIQRGTPKDLIIRLDRILTRLGVELEWSDEWGSCDDCNSLFRTQSDCHDWTPSYSYDEKKGETLCRHCAQLEEL